MFLVILSVPLAMLGNLLRVVVTAVAAHRFGTDVAAGTTFHETLGLATFALTCVALLALVPLLGRETGRPPGGQADLHRAGAGS